MLLAVLASAALASGGAPPACNASDDSAALARARALVAPSAELTHGGEYEGFDFWLDHAETLAAAWRAYGPRDPRLYAYDDAFRDAFVAPRARALAAGVRAGATRERDALRELFAEERGARGVWRTRAPDALLTASYRAALLAELAHLGRSGVPLRRPNGMNRRGAILADVALEPPLAALVDELVRPLAAALFPAAIGAGDAAELYAFAVRYDHPDDAPAGDAALDEHRDAAVATLNVCLGPAGGALLFGPADGSGERGAAARRVELAPGDAIVHLGAQRHAATPHAARGEARSNLIVWLFGEGGYVRFAPYDEAEQLSAAERWGSDLARA